MYHLTLQLNDRHRSVLVCVKLDKSEATVGLHSNFREIADRLEQRYKVRLGSVRREIPDVNSAIVGGSLLNNRLV
jgi:hypothetical protein